MSREPFAPRARLVAARLVAIALLAALPACGGRDGPGRPSRVERTGVHGAFHYRLTSELTPPRVTLGEPATWSLRATLPHSPPTAPPITSEVSPSLDLTNVKAAKQGRDGTWSCTFRVSGFDLGRVPLPRIRLPVHWPSGPDTLEFPPDTLDVDSLTAASTESLEPDRGPIRPELRPIDLVVAALGALLLAAAVVAAIAIVRSRRRARITADSAPPSEPPETAFRRALEALRSEVATLPRDRFYDRLSLAVRAYAASVTGVPALDRTTTELERELVRRGDLDAAAIAALADTLRRSDLAKFARREDPLLEARQALDEAASLAGRLTRPAGGGEG